MRVKATLVGVSPLVVVATIAGLRSVAAPSSGPDQRCSTDVDAPVPASGRRAASRPPNPDPATPDAVLASVAPPSPSSVAQTEPEGAQELFFGDTSRRRVALTFDDGPSRENTPRILEVLRRERVYATFFVLGHRVEKMPELVRRIDAEGHEVGNHTWSHPSMRSLWKSQIREELGSTSDAIEKALGRRPAWVRPPFGRYAPSALELFAELDLDVVLWSVDSLDWETDDPDVVARNVVYKATPGGIVLLHDRTSVTVHALPTIIAGLRDRGFEIVPVSTLTGLQPYQPLAGIAVASQDRR